MKVVVNRTWGMFRVSAETAAKLNLESVYDDTSRTNPELIKFVEQYPEKNPNLTIINIPENATDWEISDYDGVEHIICVIDGKIERLFD